MKIKSLEIVGFKSFPERLCVEFPEGISAVVGPNGCGKSNIVDAFRWVMGEQSVKQLRGRQMEDILFNGADSEQSAGLAEVTLTLSNENGQPRDGVIGPSEIAVTRRLFRSGDSEYLINNVPCRLKDIVQFFMDTGTGTRAYSIIEQGRIGAMVDSKPEDRRSLIDEAAGITRYKAQKKEAERKIEATKQNLVHIQTLMSETKRQLNSLDRASKKAARYKALKAELKELELILALARKESLDAKADGLSASRQALQDRLTGFITTVERMEVELEQTRLLIVQQEKITEAKADILYKLKNDFNTFRQEETFLGEQILANRSRQENLSGQLANLNEQYSNRREELARIRAGIEDSQVRVEAEKDRELKLKNANEELDREYEINARKRDSILREDAEQRSTLGRLEEKITAYEGRANDLSFRQSDISNEIENLVLESDRLTEQVAELAGEISVKEANRDETASGLLQKRKELADSQADLGELDIEERRAESSLARVTSRLATFEDIQANFGWYPEGVKALMSTPDQISPGIIGPLAEHIDIPAGFETAFENALGEKLQYILVKDKQTAVLALDFLMTNDLGRCGFIALKNFEPGADMDLAREVLGDFDLVKGPFDKPVYESERVTLTADGVYFGTDGVVVGGKPKDNEQGLLTRLREIEELKKEVHELEQEKEEISGRAQKARDSIEGIKGIINELEQSYQEVSGSLVEDEKRKSGVEIRCEEVESRKASLIKALEDLRAETVGLARDKNEAEDRRRELAGRADFSRDEMARIDENLQELNQKVMRARANHREKSLLVNTLTGRLEALRQDDIRTSDWLKETESSVTAINRDLREAGTEEERLLARKKEIAQSLEGFADSIPEAEDELSNQHKTADQLRADENEKENELRRKRRMREEANEENNKLELSIQENEFKKQALLERMEIDYGLDLLNLPADQVPERGPGLDLDEIGGARDDLKQRIEKMGEVNLTAINEQEALQERYDFYETQYGDLISSIENLRESISKINRTCEARFSEVFQAVDQKLKEIFPMLFDGGEAWLTLTDESEPLDRGVEIHVQPPGKKLTVVSLLSGGEKALVALALTFSLYLIKPSPFCLLDEIDAPLDEANIDRFAKLLKKIGQNSQIILITHNKLTMQTAETLDGITMEDPGISKIVSVNLTEIEENFENDQVAQTL
ncbi:MAG: AAA family ATPase [Candidatus Adiutricales bacterium]